MLMRWHKSQPKCSRNIRAKEEQDEITSGVHLSLHRRVIVQIHAKQNTQRDDRPVRNLHQRRNELAESESFDNKSTKITYTAVGNVPDDSEAEK
jgi:hypothetical protein